MAAKSLLKLNLKRQKDQILWEQNQHSLCIK